MSENESIHDRINLLVREFARGNNTSFAALIGSNEGSVRGYIKGVMPKHDVLEKIVRNLGINPDWLLTGRGEMTKKETTSSSHSDNRLLIETIKELSAENALLKKEIEDLKREKAPIKHNIHVDRT